MKKYIEAESFVKAMDGYRHTYGKVAKKYAQENAVEAVAVGDSLDGCVIEICKAEGGKDIAKLRRMEDVKNGAA